MNIRSHVNCWALNKSLFIIRHVRKFLEESTVMENEVKQLVTEYQHGQVSRRQFLTRAPVLLGGAAAANVLLMAASGPPIHEVAAAAGALQGTQPATMPATMAATE